MKQDGQLLANYIEGVLLKNQELHDQARRERDEERQNATVVSRLMREIQLVIAPNDRTKILG